MMVRNYLSSNTINSIPYQRIWVPLIPYITIGAGLLLLHNAWIAIVSYHLCLIIILLLAREKISFTQILSSGSYKILITTAVLGGAGGFLLFLLWPILGVPNTINLYLQNIGLNAATWPYFIAYFILVNAWVEEFYWRGHLGSNSKKVTLNDLLFSGYHLIVLAGKIDIIWLIIVFIVLSLGAWFWRQANRWNRGISASIISHIMADVSVIITIYFMTSRM
jgi:membrane protease YdiL (CAAX protease family)